MRYIIALFIASILFSSCDITKRRYLPGYSVEWKHRAAKAIVNKEPITLATHTIINKHTTPTLPEAITKTGVSTETVSTARSGLSSWTKPTQTVYHTKAGSTYRISSSDNKTAVVNITAVQPGDKKKPVFFTGDEQLDDHARKSLVDGILSLAFPAAAFLIMWGIVLSVGGTLAFPVAYSVVIFAVGCAAGLFFAVCAFIQGFLAINEINADPDTYAGKGDAILGMVLASLATITLVAYLLIRFL